jgi:hypothetical protein
VRVAVIASESEAIHGAACGTMDRFVACPPRNDDCEGENIALPDVDASAMIEV